MTFPDPASDLSANAAAGVDAGAPPRVVLAVRLLWISLLLGLPGFVYYLQEAPAGAAGVVTSAMMLALFAFGAYLNVSIQHGRNWARIVSLVLFLLGLAASVYLPGEPSATPLEDACGWLSTLLDAAAMFLLFTLPGSRWFTRVAPEAAGLDG